MKAKTKLILITPVLLTALSLTACSSDSKRVVDLNLQYMNNNSVPVETTDPSADTQIAEAASSVTQSMQQLSAVQMATHPQVRMPSPASAEINGMQAQSSLDWTGPVAPLLRKIASASHYQLQVIGSEPAIAVMVNITANNETLGQIVRDVTYQVGTRATISVYPTQRIIELRYINN